MPRRWVPMGSFLVSHLESALDRSFPGAARRGAVGARSSDRPRRRRPAGARLERARLGSCSPCAGPGQLPLSRGFSVPMVPPESGSARREEPLTGPPPDVPQQCPRPKGHVNPGYPPKVRRIIPLGMKRTTHDAFLSPFSLPYEMDCILLRFHDDHNREFCESSRPLPGPHDRNRVPIHTSVRHTRGPGGVAPGVAKTITGAVRPGRYSRPLLTNGMEAVICQRS